MILEARQLALEDNGFDAATAGRSADAIAKLDADVPAFRVLVTDLNLARGGLMWWNLARHARGLRAELPIVHMLGGAAHEWNA